MRLLNIIILISISLIIGCNINSGDSRPEFIEDLYQREQLPDSVGLDAQIEISKTHNDSITVELFITNEIESDKVIIHSVDFATIFIYDASRIVYPTFDPNKIVYADDYNESIIPARDQIQISKMVLKRTPEFTGAEAIGFAHFTLKPGNTKDFSASAVANSQEYWLVTPPITIE